MNIRCRAASAVALLVLAFATPAGAGDTPYDDVAEVRNALYSSCSVWQIYSIEIE